MPQPTPPSAPTRPHVLTAHGRTRNDPWYWLRNREDPEVIAYLEAENAYADAVLAPTSALQETLFQEIRGRVQETDAGPPARSGDWWYYSRTVEGKQYPIMCRRPDPKRRLGPADVTDAARAGTPDDEEVVLDENELAVGDYLAVGVFDVSPDHTLLAYAVDLDGSEEYALKFRDLDSGEDRPDTVTRVYYGSAWSTDNRTFFYVRPDAAMRPWQIWCHILGTDPSEDTLVHQEDDERFFLDVGLSRSRQVIHIDAASKTTSEVLWLDAARPGRPQVLVPRRTGVEYQAEHDGDGWFVLSNEPDADGRPATNFHLYRIDDRGRRVTVLPHRADVKLEAVDSFASFTVVTERSAVDGLERLRVIERDGPDGTGLPGHVIEQPEAAYSLLGGQNPDWDQTAFRFGYTSLVTPRTSVDYHVAERQREPVWAQLVPGYDPARFRTERVWADASDGTRIPISLVVRADAWENGPVPALLYGYGAYEVSMDPTFSAVQLNLVERGAAFAIAHIRGGGELGRGWYEQGRMEHKVNTFTDFVAAAEALVAGGRVDRERLVARGGSAGGLLMGAVLNMRPDLWRAVVAEVPFVDVVTTMCDTTLPLTVTEWEEWGDPLHDAAAFERMLSYSPYDNVGAPADPDRFPAVYVTAGLNDPRVGFWEPAKWVARLRASGAGTTGRPVLLRTELGAGHGGPSGRYDTWRDEARIQAFVLTQMGLA